MHHIWGSCTSTSTRCNTLIVPPSDFPTQNSFKNGHQTFHISNFMRSIICSWRTLFMLYFLENGLAGRVQIHGHLGTLLWHLLISSFDICKKKWCLHGRNSNPGPFKRKNPKSHRAHINGYASTCMARTELDMRTATDTAHVKNY